jgi:O-acetyl-ADP-ribose deacetylase (regulator of RNase III)
MADTIALSEIPTLSLLYKLKRIAPAEDLDKTSLPAPNSAYNDKISVIRQDITVLGVDAIVNAANNSLLGGGGVDGAIHRAAGPELLDECETLEGCETGSAKITDGYELPAFKVIHAVGPIYWKTKSAGKHTELLSGCYRKSLELAVENDLQSIAFSALSTGVYGYPSGEASEVALDTVRKFLEEGKGDKLERIVFCNFMQKDEDAYFENIPYVPRAVNEHLELTMLTENTSLPSKPSPRSLKSRASRRSPPRRPNSQRNSPTLPRLNLRTQRSQLRRSKRLMRRRTSLWSSTRRKRRARPRLV